MSAPHAEAPWRAGRWRGAARLARRTLAALGLALLAVPLATSARADAPHEASIHLYVSPTTQSYFAAQRQSYDRVLERWRPMLRRYGSHAQTLSREQLLAGAAAGVLILPTSVALDGQERAAIERFVAQGGSLLGTGLVVTRDAHGNASGVDFLQRVFHVRTHGFFAPSDDTFFMPFGDGPLTWTIPAARRMGIANTRDSLLRISARNEAAVVMDWSRTRQTEPHAAMAFDEVGASRIAYIAVPDTHWSSQKQSALLIGATLDWLRREAQAFKPAWPNGKVAAHLIEMDTEDKFVSADNFARHLDAHGFKGTFYCLTSEAAAEPKLVRDLLSRGHEIGYHADVHFGFKGDTLHEQELRIRFMKQQMQGILGEQVGLVTGFRAPTESYDRVTEMLLRKHGLLHHAADESAHEDRLPFFSVAERGVPAAQALVVLPRTQPDDVTFMAEKRTPQQVRDILGYDLELAIRSGAFSLLSVHSQNYVKGGLMELTMDDYLRHVASHRHQLWVARGDEIAHWWRQREAVSVNHHWRADGLHVRVDNANASPVPGFTVMLSLPLRQARVRLAGATPRAMKAHIQPIDAFRSAIVFDSLPPGLVEVSLAFDAPAAPGQTLPRRAGPALLQHEPG